MISIIITLNILAVRLGVAEVQLVRAEVRDDALVPPRYDKLCYAKLLYYNLLYFTILCYTILYYNILCYNIL